MPTRNPFQIDFETVVAASPMLGHELENRSSIRGRQDLQLLERLQESSVTLLQHAAQQDSFVCAPLDVLVSREEGQPKFHIIELNGTGIGGVSNMPACVVESVAESLEQVARTCWQPNAVLLLPISGKECNAAPRLNKLVHEKLLFAEALKSGFAAAGTDADIVTCTGLNSGTQAYRDGVSTIALGYIKEFLDACELREDGRVFLHGRPVVGAVNDRFCLNLIGKFGGKMDLSQFAPINGTYLAGGDKGVAYSLLDEYLLDQPSKLLPERVHHQHATNREELISTVLQWLRLGRLPVIKPHGTGIGHGIEFFLDPEESNASVTRRIDASIRITEEYYSASGGAFPYTICEFVNSAVIPQEHRLSGHKYELRIVVYRDGLSLKACPTIAKVANQRFDAEHTSRDNLINNITNSSFTRKTSGTEFMLPLCHEATLQTLDLAVDELEELCRVATQYVRFAIDEIPSMAARMNRLHSPKFLPVVPPLTYPEISRLVA